MVSESMGQSIKSINRRVRLCGSDRLQEIDDQIYVLSVIASVIEGNPRIIGDQHALVVLISENSSEEAQKSAKEILKRSSWEFLEIKEISLLAPKLGISEETEEIINDAIIHGSSIIVFADPIPKN